jgi:hypothetical protein
MAPAAMVVAPVAARLETQAPTEPTRLTPAAAVVVVAALPVAWAGTVGLEASVASAVPSARVVLLARVQAEMEVKA